MHDFLQIGKRPEDPRALLEQIAARYPDPQKRWQLFFSIVLEDPPLLRICVEHAFNAWTSRPPQ